MRILLIGEYSNVHATLAKSLRKEGHEVLLVSDGDGWKNYPRDIDVSRRYSGILGSVDLHLRWLWNIRKMKGFDIVNLINPHFTDMSPSWDARITNYLAKNNKHLTLGLYGDDYIVMKGQREGILEYSDTWAYGKDINTESEGPRIHEWTESCKTVCENCIDKSEALIAGLYEYYKLYEQSLDQKEKQKLYYVNFPIEEDTGKVATSKDISVPSPSINVPSCLQEGNEEDKECKVKVLIAINKKRIKLKGTDQLIKLFERLEKEHPDKVMVTRAESVPFKEYQKMISEIDVLVDQLYSYTPGMNALEGMAQGKVVVSGGEEEFYSFIGEKDLRPIINLRPFHDEENYAILEETILDKKLIEKKKQEGREFIRKYHNASKVAQQYIDIWSRLN